MKKMIIGIIIGIIVTLVIVTVTILVYTKFFMFVPDKGGMINQDIEPTGDIKTYEDSVEFKCMTVRGCKAVEVNTTNGTTIKFNDNQCLAIGYVLDSNIDEFIHNNFYNKSHDNNLQSFYNKTKVQVSINSHLYCITNILICLYV